MSTNKAIFNGTGLSYFSVPDAVMGSKELPGVLFDMSPTQLRLYMFILWRASQAGELSVSLGNADVRAYTGLDSDSLPRVRRELANRNLIAFDGDGRGATRVHYSITSPRTGERFEAAAVKAQRWMPRRGSPVTDLDDGDEWGKMN